jgi:hypothetical protein
MNGLANAYIHECLSPHLAICVPSRRENVGREMGMPNGKAFSQIFTGNIGIFRFTKIKNMPVKWEPENENRRVENRTVSGMP